MWLNRRAWLKRQIPCEWIQQYPDYLIKVRLLTSKLAWILINYKKDTINVYTSRNNRSGEQKFVATVKNFSSNFTYHFLSQQEDVWWCSPKYSCILRFIFSEKKVLFRNDCYENCVNFRIPLDITCCVLIKIVRNPYGTINST
jgi:hypothetical protein